MTSRPWHKRWHDKALGGMRGLSLELRGAYNTLLDLMYDNEGPVRLDERRQSAEMDCDIRVFRRVIGALIQAEKIHFWSDGRTVYIVNEKVQTVLGGEQFEASTSAELPAEVREKFGVANAELTRKSARKPNKNSQSPEKTTPKNAPRGERREEEPPKPPEGEGQLSLVPATEEIDTVRQAFDLWNETAARCGLPKAEDLTDKRRKAIGKRLEAGGLPRWRKALDSVEHSKLCRGLRPDSTWKANIDFVCSPSGFQKLVEGNYARDAKPPAAPVAKTPADPLDRWRRPMRAFTASQYWNTTDDGPKPGKPGCEVPASVLAEFGLAPPESQLFPTDPSRSAA
jgi:hypothetical protein